MPQHYLKVLALLYEYWKSVDDMIFLVQDASEKLIEVGMAA